MKTLARAGLTKCFTKENAIKVQHTPPYNSKAYKHR